MNPPENLTIYSTLIPSWGGRVRSLFPAILGGCGVLGMDCRGIGGLGKCREGSGVAMKVAGMWVVAGGVQGLTEQKLKTLQG